MSSINKNIILYVHQSADMYGSDRALLSLISALDKEKFIPVVLLPVRGALVNELEALNIEYYIIAIALLSRSVITFRGLFMLPIILIKSLRDISRVLSGRKVSLVHTNTLAVFSSAVWAWLYGVPHLWHVHEIIERPLLVRKAYSYLLDWFADCILCVSHATKDNLVSNYQPLVKKIEVIWNGFERTSPIDNDAALFYRESLRIDCDEVMILLVGRINRWKGQVLLVDAANLLWNKGLRNIRYVFVGSPPNYQDHFLNELLEAINRSPARSAFNVEGFRLNLWPIWDAADIVVIPSVEPEPFGLVALEAMAAMKPVIGANHGGLSEILKNGETGFLVQPKDPQALACAIEQLVDDANLRLKMGRAGLLLLQEKFMPSQNVDNIVGVYKKLIGSELNVGKFDD